MSKIDETLRLLGLKVKDRVTQFEGIVTSVGFDLYGCIQAVVTPEMTAPAKVEDSRWFDTSRLEILHAIPVMAVPQYGVVPKSTQVPGGFDKPIPR
jgi:hypothetical protein